MEKNCLLCLEVNKDFLNYFNVYEPKCGEYHAVSLIEKHLWPVTALKSQSQWLCSMCWKALRDFHQFYSRLEDVQTYFDHEIKSENIKTPEYNLFEHDNGTVETIVVKNEITDEESIGPIDNISGEEFNDETSPDNNKENDKENENISAILQKVLSNQALMLDKLSNVESEFEKLKADQVQTSVVIKQFVRRNLHVENVPDFPIPNLEEMERINSLVCTDPHSFIAKIRTILRPAGLEKNFDRIFASEVYVALNFDGVNGKRGFKEFKALHDAVFEAVKDEGYTADKFKKELQHCFKTYKNRFFAKKCRDKKK